MVILGRSVLVFVVFIAVGAETMHLLIAYAVAHGTPEVDVRLAGAMGGLFVGGVAASVVLLVLLLTGRKKEPNGM